MKGKAVPYPDDEKWKVEADLETLIRAAEIRKDPKRMAAVKTCAKDKKAALAAIDGGK